MDDYQLTRNPGWLYEKKIVVYGVGKVGQEINSLLQRIGVTAYCLAQTTPKEENSVANISIRPIHALFPSMDSENTLIIVASSVYYEEMIQHLSDIGFQRAKICTYYSLYLSISLHATYNRFPDEFRTFLRLQDAYGKELAIADFSQAYLRALLPMWEDNVKVLVFTAGKVGTASMINSLGNAHIPYTYTHTIAIPYVLNRNRKMDYHDSSRLMRNRGQKIISMVRNPFARDFSAFFETLDQYHWPSLNNLYEPTFLHYANYIDRDEALYTEELREEAIPKTNDCIKMCRSYMEKIVAQKSDEFSWFDYEVKTFWGIDVYAYPFDKENGYTMIKNGRVELLLMKLEFLDRLENVISEFVGSDTFHLQRSNTMQKKAYKYLYRYVKERIDFSKAYMDYYIENKKALHFYSKEELVSGLQAFTSVKIKVIP